MTHARNPIGCTTNEFQKLIGPFAKTGIRTVISLPPHRAYEVCSHFMPFSPLSCGEGDWITPDTGNNEREEENWRRKPTKEAKIVRNLAPGRFQIPKFDRRRVAFQLITDLPSVAHALSPETKWELRLQKVGVVACKTARFAVNDSEE